VTEHSPTGIASVCIPYHFLFPLFPPFLRGSASPCESRLSRAASPSFNTVAAADSPDSR